MAGDKWVTIPADGTPLPEWGGWTISVQLAAMPDGTVAPIGLHITPRDDYDGSRRDQRLTTEKMRRFPLGYVTDAAKTQVLTDPTEKVLAEHDAAIAAAALAADRAQERSARLKKKVERRDAEQYAARVAEVGEKQARLERVAMLYRAAQYRPLGTGGPRKEVADALGLSPRTVDKLLAEARRTGVLEPYDGPQGKHGKPTTRKDKR